MSDAITADGGKSTSRRMSGVWYDLGTVMVRIALLILAAWTLHAQWPTPKSANDAYEYVNSRRDEAEKLWSQNDPKGLAILEDVLRYMDQPLLRDLANGNVYLAARRPNIQMDFAAAYAIAGDPGRSVAILRDLARTRPDPAFATFLERHQHLASLRDRLDFKEVMQAFRAFVPYWDTTAFATAFQENLSDAEKIAGLSKLWSEVKYNFGYPEKLLDVKWDALYLQTIPRVLEAKSTLNYYRELMMMIARLGDGHTNVYPPEQLDITSKPPIRTGLVEGKVIILDVLALQSSDRESVWEWRSLRWTENLR